MLFKRAQVLDLLGISQDTLRHWKKALPPISLKDGRADDYTFAELVSLAIVARATQHLRVQVSLFTELSPELFSEVASLMADERYGRVLYIDNRHVGFAEEDQIPMSEAVVLIRLEPIVTHLMTKIGTTEDAPAQLALPLLL